MSVTTYNKTYGSVISGNDISVNAEVKLICSDENIKPPMFYITKRSVEGNITKWTCCDIMSKTEKQLHFEESDFTNEHITFGNALEIIKQQCGIYDFDLSGMSLVINNELENCSCENSTGRDILELLSNDLCGYWIANGLMSSFVHFGKSNFSVKATSFSQISYGGLKRFSRIICTDDENIYISGNGDELQTLICSSYYASQEKANYIFGTMVGSDSYYDYQAWSCAKGKLSAWGYLGDIVLGTEILLCSKITLTPSPTGLYFSALRNNISEDETDYMSEVKRQLKKRLELNKINNNFAVRNDGLFFFENGYKQLTAEEQQKSRYSFNVDRGVTEYDGAMTSKIVPSTAEINEDKTEAIITYGDKKYKYSVEWNNGKIIGFAKTEVKE